MVNDYIFSLIHQQIDPDKILKKYSSLKSARKPWDAKWQTIQDQVFPDYRDYVSDVQTTQPKTNKIKNHTGTISGKINKVVSLLSAQTCDPAVKWLDIKFANNDLNRNYAASSWLYGCKEALYSLFADPESEFYTSTYSFHLDWFSIGNACREIVLRKDTGQIHFATVSMQDIYIETSAYGCVETTFRRLNLTAKQAVSLYGQNCHPTMMQQAEQSESQANPKKYEFVEVILDNPLRDKIPTLKYISCVIDVLNKNVVDVGLHAVSPYIVSRFFVVPGETYGRSYVWNAMPDITALNRLSKRILQGVDFATLPVVLVKDGTSIPQAQITPGSFIQGLDVNGHPTFQQMTFGGNVPMAMEYYNAKLNDLEDSLVARDIFPAEAPNMTATEVNERKIQASNRIRPLLVRLEAEDLHKTVIRSLKLLEQLGQLPPFPYEELELVPEQLPDPIGMLRVTFSGQMAKMQRLQDISNMDSIFQKVVQLAQVDPSVLDRINVDQIVANEAEIYDVPKNVINSDEVVEQIRTARQAQQEAQQQAESESAMLDNFIKLKEAGIVNDEEGSPTNH